MRLSVFTVLFICFGAAELRGQAPARRPQPGGNQQQQQQQPEVPADCGASGTVVNALTGQALIRASVLVNSPSGMGTMGASTDAEGKWSISGISCEPISFSAEKDGFIANTYGRPATLPPTSPSPGTRPVPLVSGSPAKDLKMELMPEAVVSGRVLDDAGEAAPGAQVRMMRSVVQNGKRTVQYAGLANADNTGAYRIGNVMAGRFFICATYGKVRYPVGGGNPSAYGESCYPGPASGGSAGALKIEGGKEVRTDFTLSRMTGVHVRGTVSGIPPGQNYVMVQLIRADNNGMMLGTQARPQQVRNGKFEFPNVTPGSYQPRANSAVAGEMLSAAMPVNVGSTDLEGVVLSFEPGAVVSGTVKFESSDVPPRPQPMRHRRGL